MFDVIVSIFLLLLLFLPVMIYMFAVNNHHARQGNLLWYLAIAVEKQMPLPEEIENYANGLRGSNRERVRDLAEMLHDGIPLSTALGNQRGLVPAFAVMAVRTGEETGTLPQALRGAAVRCTSQMQQAATGPSVAWFFIYYWAITTVTMSILTFLMYFIVPKFKKIFWDFGTELPDSTNTLIAAADFAASNFILIAPILLLPTVVLIVAGVGYARGWENTNPRWFSQRFPRFDAPSILRSLAMIVRAEQSVLDGLNSLAQQHHRTAIRERLETVADAVAAGDDCWRALHQQRFIDEYEYAVLESAQQVGNLSWALNELADSIERRWRFRLSFWFEILRPIVVVIIGLAVAFVFIAFFMPLVKLIEDLS